MQHTIAAVFDRQNQAEQAIDDLVASGYSRDDLHLSQSVAGEQVGQVQEDVAVDGRLRDGEETQRGPGGPSGRLSAGAP